MSVKILIGDVFEKLRELPDESVHCVVTSPPYWGLRSYLDKDDPKKKFEIGLEPSLGEHLEVLVSVFREVRRVLRSDGTCWVNYGDCYATSPNGRSAADTKAAGNDDRTFRDKPFSTVQGRMKPKDLCMVANRLAIALQDDGWWVRSEIVWFKRNPMPESITDRPGVAHEKIWLLSKSSHYFYDNLAVRRELRESSIARYAQNISAQSGSARANGGSRAKRPMKAVGGLVRGTPPYPSVWQPGEGTHSTLEHNRPDKQRGHSRRHAGFNERWDRMTRDEQQSGGANLKNVWDIPVRGYREAHFATFPPEIPEKCIKAGTSEHGVCVSCGMPWRREIEKRLVPTSKAAKTGIVDARDLGADFNDHGANRQKDGHIPGWRRNDLTLGWFAGCKCPENSPIPATVLDPFGGAGTTALVADRLGREAVIIELNDKYADLARERIYSDAPLFADVE